MPILESLPLIIVKIVRSLVVQRKIIDQDLLEPTIILIDNKLILKGNPIVKQTDKRQGQHITQVLEHLLITSPMSL